MTPRHILITGRIHAGKSTLIRRLLEHCSLPVYGFRTWGTAPDDEGWRMYYISPVSEEGYTGGEDNCIGASNGIEKRIFPRTFETVGVPLLNHPSDVLVVMDEIGNMEENAPDFRAAVMRCLAGPDPVIAAVKDRNDSPFLEAVLNHPDAAVYRITPENREELFETLLPVIIGWNREGGGL